MVSAGNLQRRQQNIWTGVPSHGAQTPGRTQCIITHSDERNEPRQLQTSGLSSFGHIPGADVDNLFKDFVI